MQSKFKAVIGQIALLGGITNAGIMAAIASAQAAPQTTTGTVSTASTVGPEAENLTEFAQCASEYFILQPQWCGSASHNVILEDSDPYTGWASVQCEQGDLACIRSRLIRPEIGYT